MNTFPKSMTLQDYRAQALPVRNRASRNPATNNRGEVGISRNESKNFEQIFQSERHARNEVNMAKSASPIKEEIKTAIREASQDFAIPEQLLHSVIKTESNFNPKAVSPAGAKGLMQLMPGTAKEMGVKNVFDVEDNIRGGAKYLRNMLNKFGQNIKLALAAYNAGPGAVKKHGGIPPYEETQKYVSKVINSSIPKA